jgi:DNA-binding GntR family transcriptional regulator
MAELEARCGRLAARRMTDAERKALLAAHQACQTAQSYNDSDAYFYCYVQFHSAIYTGSHNTFLIEQAHALQRRLRPYRRLQLRVRNRLAASFSEHQSVVEAITAGDTEGAALALRSHVVVQGERFADLLASLHALNPQPEAA